MRSLKVKSDSTAPDTFDMVPVGTCNISRSASRVFTNAMLFFDFGSAAIRNAGCFHPLLGTWLMHEKLFISRYDQEDLAVFAMPADRPYIPLAQAIGIGVKWRPAARPGVHGTMPIWSKVKATRIVVYSVLGQQLAVLTKTGDKEINAEKFLNRLRPGIFFIGIESQGQKRQIVRWVSTHQK